MRGVDLTAAELSRLGFIASPTSRSALAADILVTDQACQRAFPVQVKTNSTAATFWLVCATRLVHVNTPMSHDRTLRELREEFGRSRFLAMPIAGAVAWSAAGVFGAILPDADSRSIALFLCMPAVFPLGLLFARFTGEDLLAAKSRNELDRDSFKTDFPSGGRVSSEARGPVSGARGLPAGQNPPPQFGL